MEEDLSDIKSILFGREHRAVNGEQIDSLTRAEELYKNVKADYPNSKIEVLGYSKGGRIATHVGEKFDVESTTFNPFLSPLQKVPENIGSAKQNIYRIHNDWTTSDALYIYSSRNQSKYHALQSN